MTDTWDNEGGAPLRELEATVEGLGQENTDLGQRLEALSRAARLAADSLQDLSEVPLADLVDSIKVIRQQLEYELALRGAITDDD